jgi:hypothetical protein
MRRTGRQPLTPVELPSDYAVTCVRKGEHEPHIRC